MKIDKLLFFISFFVLAFWLIGKILPIYTFTIVGVVYEILWLPMLLLLFILPVLDIFHLARKKQEYNRWLLICSLVLSLTTLAFISLS